MAFPIFFSIKPSNGEGQENWFRQRKTTQPTATTNQDEQNVNLRFNGSLQLLTLTKGNKMFKMNIYTYPK